MNIFFWQSNISPHQMPYITELVKMGNNVTLIVPKVYQIKSREDIGWTTPDTTGVNLIVNPDLREIEEIFDAEGLKHSIHCFSGIDFHKMVFNGFKTSLKKDVFRVLLVEGPNLKGCRFLIRWIYAKFKYHKYKRKIHLVMAIGSNAATYYRFIGVSEDRIKPFLYCVEDTRSDKVPNVNKDFRVLYLGGLLKIKGLDLLLKAYKGLNQNKFYLDIYGSGPLEVKLKNRVLRHGLDKVRFKGVIQHSQVKVVLSNYDLLILPSRKDGWGAVVNEALMAGTPVLCSDNCGAKQLIENELIGSIFESGNVRDLKKKMLQRFLRGPIQIGDRQKIMEFAKQIHKENVSKYFCCELEKIIKK
jgi:glycosyltransferase involved in cell wall biosynthesis